MIPEACFNPLRHESGAQMTDKQLSWFAQQVRANPITRQLARWWVTGRDTHITAGMGRGLRFNAAHSNPAYSLGTNELPVQAAISEHLRPGNVFYDIGANVGFFTILAAARVGDHGQVVAFEPVPQNVQAICHNVALNHFQQVTVVQKAASDHEGEAALIVTSTSGGATLASAGHPQDADQLITVDLIRVDTCIQREKMPIPQVIKIDVEGAEIEVFMGMQATLQAHHPVVIYEVDDEDPSAFEKKRLACEAFLQTFGYQITRLEDSYPQSGWLVANYLALPAR